MKTFIKRLSLFIIPFWIVLSIIDFTYSKIAARTNNFEIETWCDLIKGTIDADVIINGNSRAVYQINPLILDSVLGINTYNIGMDGGPANRHIRKYNVFRKYNRKPRVIIQNIDCLTMLYKVGYNREQFFPYWWNTTMRKEFFSSEPLSFWEKYVPLYRYKDYGLTQFLSSAEFPMLIKGYQGVEKPWDGNEFEKIDTIQCVFNDTTVNMFKEYVANVRKENIVMIFVFAPIYVGVTEKTTNINEMYEFYKGIAHKYRIPILDYTYMDICNDTTFFYNATHLNKRGAEIFSDSLAKDIKELSVL